MPVINVPPILGKRQPQTHRPTDSPNSYIQFYGEAFFSASNNKQFKVLAGDQAPMIVGGYGKWTTIDRPLHRGVTTFQGYDPISIQVSVRFMRFSHGGWATDDDARTSSTSENPAGFANELDIFALEWMAGETWGSGPSPKVWMTTFDGNANTTPLIPFEYQAATPGTPSAGETTPWVITSLQWDPSPIKSRYGYRIKQDATVTLQLYSTVDPVQNRGLSRTKAVYVTSRTGTDTALKIARSQSTHDPGGLAYLIRNAPQNVRLRLRSDGQPIKHGKRVYVPAGN
jgi:hypothetical protein